MDNSRLLSVVVPVYGSAAILPELTRRLHAVLQGRDYEILLVNDGSADESWRRIEELGAADGRIRGLDLMRNYGQHNALLCGIRAARGDVIVTIDDDLQNPPEEIPQLLAELDRGFDVVYGAPRVEQHGVFRDLASRCTKFALKHAMGVPIARDVSAFRAFRASLREAFAEYHNPFISIDVLLAWGTSRFSSVRVRHEPRLSGRSHYSLHRLVVHAFNMLTGFSIMPLQLASILGFVFSGFGGLILVFVVSRRLMYGAPVPGFAFLASILSIFSGIQLFALGIIGEYMARIHFRTLAKPQYVVRACSGTLP